MFFALAAGSTSEIRRLPDGSVLVPDALLAQKLSAVRMLQRQHGFDLDPDEASRALILEFIEQATLLKRARLDPTGSLSAKQVTDGLEAAGFLRRLTPEQTRDVGRLAYLENGANFSVPGAGKTTSLLAIHAIERVADMPLKLLVVAPRNAFISWDEEIELCLGPESSMVRLTGGHSRIAALLREDPDIVGITYQQLPLVIADVQAFERRNRVHLVLDESHRAKGGSRGVQGAAVLAIAPLARRRDILSGTPMPQGITDLGPQFDFLWPGHSLCSSFERSDSDDQAVQVQQANAALSPFFVRTKKCELGLAKPVLHLKRVQLGAQQRELYELMRSEAARLASGFDRTDRSKLRALGKQVVRMIQAASNPQLLLSSLERGNGVLAGDHELIFLLRSMLRDEMSAKLVELDALIAGLLADADAKVVVWSSFVGNVDYLVSVYSRFNAVGIHGGVPTGDDEDLAFREARIKRFNTDPDCRVMVGNPAACGEGISLHRACHNAVYLDRTYNAAHYLQSVDRIHRLGLPKDVDTNVFLLIAENTIDESLDLRVTQKIAALGALLDDDQLKALAYDPEDIVDDMPAGLGGDDIDSVIAHVVSAGRDVC